MCSWICARQNRIPRVWRNIILLSILQQEFHGTLLFLKTCGGVTWVLRVPWGFLVFFRGNDFLLQYVDGWLWKTLDHRAAFRFQAGQLVVQVVESRKRNICSCCVACCSLCNEEERYCCITVIRCCRCAVHSRERRPPRTFAVYSKM